MCHMHLRSRCAGSSTSSSRKSAPRLKSKSSKAYQQPSSAARQGRFLDDPQAKRGAWIAAAQLNANQFIERLTPLGSPEHVKKAQRYLEPGLKDRGGVDVSIGARMGDVFALAKEFTDMPLDEVEVLLDSPVHEVRVGAVSIMDFQARNKRTPPKRRKELFDLYIRRHDRINTWDLVDRSAPYVVGGYLFDKPRDILYQAGPVQGHV